MVKEMRWVKRRSATNVSCTGNGELRNTFVQWLLRSDGLVWFRQSDSLDSLRENPEVDAPEKKFGVDSMLVAHSDFFKTEAEFDERFKCDLYLLDSSEVLV